MTGLPLPTRTAVFLLLALVCRAGHATESFVVLLYHHVAEDTPPVTSVSPEEFANHLNWLEDHGFSVWPLKEALDALHSDTPLPPRTVVITFDDAYEDIYANAWPMLREHGMPFTVFVATQAVDQGHAGIMSWDQLRTLAGAGVTLATHSHTHNHLIRKRADETTEEWLARVRHDLLTARRRLTEETGVTSHLLAWPFGEYNQKLDRLAESLGFTAFTQASGAVGPGYDRQRLPRFPVAGPYADLETLKNKFDALPLPVVDKSSPGPQLTADQRRPTLTLTLGPGHFRVEDITCYVSGQGAVTPERIGEQRIRVRAPEPLPPGRSRYNCTVHSTRADRWYWYSQPWFLPKKDGTWPSD